MKTVNAITLLSCFALPLLAQDGKQDAPKVEAPKQEAPKVLQLGQRVSGDLTLADLDGKAVKANDLMGKVTVVNFFSTQCPVQKAWDKRLADIQTEYEAQGVTFLHIDSNTTEIDPDPKKPDQKPVDALKAHLKEKALPFRVLLDHGNVAADLFDARTTPHIYVFGKDGRLVYKGLVDDDQKDRNIDKRNNYLRDTLGKILKDDKVEPFATKEEGCSIKRVKKPALAVPADAPKAKEEGKQ
jgi:thiol-disulfide isomerase/thioredoxin